jgi:hypothetical protein
MLLVVLYLGLELDIKDMEWGITLLTSLSILIQPRLIPSVQSTYVGSIHFIVVHPGLG